MAQNEKVPVKSEQLEEDTDAYDNLLLVKGYSPRLEEFSIEMVTALKDKLDLAERNLNQTEKRVKEERQNLIAAQWAFHNSILGCKGQVISQFGVDSNEIQSLGLKKKSDYRPRKRKVKTDKKTA
ncbi:MAG: hypothetical protein HOP30_22125 [Cyclobacteriaceae bacterium]|nr:hypothetical protein [Cyclobacteriaceae bacterium]